MSALVLTLVLAAAPPPASKAVELSNKGQWEELYLAFAAVPAKGYSDADKKKLAAALAKGCEALEPTDAAMAIGLGEKAIEMEPVADALLCVGKVGPKVE